jgi:hypothetical protein
MEFFAQGATWYAVPQPNDKRSTYRNLLSDKGAVGGRTILH